MNISVITAGDIEERGISNPEDYLRTLAGVSTPGGDSFFIIRGFHEFCTNAIIALIAIHILAALYHHFIAKDDTTKKMLLFWRSQQQ